MANISSLGPKEQKTGVNAVLQPIGNATAPRVPTDVQVAAGDEEVTVTWKPPTNNGGLPITRYNVEGAPYGACETLGDQICTIKGLGNGQGYAFSVQARNSAGLSPQSAPSVSAMPYGKPMPPTRVNATPGLESATVSWTPGNSNGRPITEYTVTSSPGGKTCSASTTTCTVAGLPGGVAHTFTVKARNLADSRTLRGRALRLTPSSAPVSPAPDQTPQPSVTPPTAPADLKLTVKKRKATIQWAAVPGASRHEARVHAIKGKPGGWKKVTKPVYTTGKLKKGAYAVQVRAVGPAGVSPVTTKRFKVK